MKYIGIDYGSKKIGIAVSDDFGQLARPHSVVVNNAQCIPLLVELIARLHITGIICGLSSHGDSENAVAAQARECMEVLTARTQLPIVYEWEGYTTSLARTLTQPRAHRGVVADKRTMHKGMSSYKEVDDRAAAIMLQSFLDKQVAQG